jgi:hypothetical protein
MTKIPDVLKAQAANPKPCFIARGETNVRFGHWILEVAPYGLRTVEIYLEFGAFSS